MNDFGSDRHGRFHFPESWLQEESGSDLYRSILSLCVPYQIRRSYNLSCLEVWAVSDRFRSVGPGEMIPEYGLNIEMVVLPDEKRTVQVFKGFADSSGQAVRTVRKLGEET